MGDAIGYSGHLDFEMNRLAAQPSGPDCCSREPKSIIRFAKTPKIIVD